MELEIGTITKWNDEKGFGFITPKSGGKQIFIHINEFSKHHQRPIHGLSVAFGRKIDATGRNYAVHVCPQKGHKKTNKADRQLFFSIILSSAFFLVVGVLVAINKLPIIVLGAYMVLSIAAFGIYQKDKSAAERDEWRTPENTLHFISLLGGWPGALIAQNKLRHKSKKLSFKIIYWATVLINCIAFAWLFTPNGAARLKALIGYLDLV